MKKVICQVWEQKEHLCNKYTLHLNEKQRLLFLMNETEMKPKRFHELSVEENIYKKMIKHQTKFGIFHEEKPKLEFNEFLYNLEKEMMDWGNI